MMPTKTDVNLLTLPSLGTIKINNKSPPINLNYAVFLKFKLPIQGRIPDDIFNDIKGSTLNNLSKQTVYGVPITDECKYGLNNLLTNSYINANIGKYTKLESMLDSTIPLNSAKSALSGSTTAYTYQLNVDKNGNNIIKQNQITNKNPDEVIFGVENQLTTTFPDCGLFYENLCQYHYYYDNKDGLLYNKSFNDRIQNDQNIGSYKNNLQYLNDHIPDCRCLAGRISGSVSNLNEYYSKAKCMSKDDSSTSVISGGNRYGIEDNCDSAQCGLYNYTIDDGNNSNAFKDKGYRNQRDPIYISAGLVGGQFLYAGLARARNDVYNSYTCNILSSIDNTGVGGNISIGNINLNCNFGCSNVKPSDDPVPGVTSMSVSYSDRITNKRYSLNNPNFEISIMYNTPLATNITWSDQAYEKSFITPSNYVFAFYLGSDTKKYINARFECIGGMKEDKMEFTDENIIIKSCNGPYLVYTPFIIGRTTSNSEKYILALVSGKTNKITSRQVIVYMKQYGMKISNVIMAGFTSNINTNYDTQPNANLSVTINVDCNIDDRFDLNYRITLKPLVASSSDGTPNSIIIIDGNNFFNDFAINASGIGFYKLENTPDNILYVIKQIPYTISVSLGMEKDLLGTYYVDNPPYMRDMYFSDCGMDTDFFLVDGTCRLGLIELSGLGINSYKPQSLKINPSKLTVAVKEQKKLNITILPNITFDKEIIWIVDDPEVVSISNTGVVTGLIGGNTTITGRTHAKTANKEYLEQTIEVTVIQTESDDSEDNIFTNPLFIGIVLIVIFVILNRILN
jgi:hypothetical protein